MRACVYECACVWVRGHKLWMTIMRAFGLNVFLIVEVITYTRDKSPFYETHFIILLSRLWFAMMLSHFMRFWIRSMSVACVEFVSVAKTRNERKFRSSMTCGLLGCHQYCIFLTHTHRQTSNGLFSFLFSDDTLTTLWSKTIPPQAKNHEWSNNKTYKIPKISKWEGFASKWMIPLWFFGFFE